MVMFLSLASLINVEFFLSVIIIVFLLKLFFFQYLSKIVKIARTSTVSPDLLIIKKPELEALHPDNFSLIYLGSIFSIKVRLLLYSISKSVLEPKLEPPVPIRKIFFS